MPYLLTRWLVALTCFLMMPGWAATQEPTGTLVLSDDTPSFEITDSVQTWVDLGSRATIEVAALSPKSFEPVPALERIGLTGQDTLWIKLLVKRPAGNSMDWTLSIPLPFIDAVTLYQPGPNKSWLTQSAGDTVAQSSWTKKWLYPDFDLNLTSAAPQEIYLRVRNFKHLSIPLRLTPKPEREIKNLREILSIGLVLGLLLALSALSGVRYLEHKNQVDAGALAYSVLIMVTVAQFNGVLNITLWTELPAMGDYAFAVIPVIGLGAAVLFARKLCSLSTRYPRYDAALYTVGWGTITSVVAYMVLDRQVADWIGYSAMVLASSMTLLATLLSWRSNSPIWPWLLLAYVPQWLVLMRLMVEAFGVAPTFWEMRYLMSLSMALSVPVLLYALSRTTHDRKELAFRASHLPTQDALTGLLTEEVFFSHLSEAYSRAVDDREPMALVLVKIINHERIRRTLGDPVAEQSLLRGVVKLHRVLRDVDPAGRVGTASFALLLEGVKTRQKLTERMVQLIASGLIPLPGLTPAVTLQFHVASVLLHENPVSPETVLEQLNDVLEAMSPQTRRPIRFLEPVPTQAGALHTDTPLG